MKKLLLLSMSAALLFGCSESSDGGESMEVSKPKTFEEAFAITPPEWLSGTWVNEDIDGFYIISEDNIKQGSNIPNNDVTKIYDEDTVTYLTSNFNKNFQAYNKSTTDFEWFYLDNLIEDDIYTFHLYSVKKLASEKIFTKISEDKITVQSNSPSSDLFGDIETFNKYE